MSVTTTFSPAPKPAPRDKPTKAPKLRKPRKAIPKMSPKLAAKLAARGSRAFSTIRPTEKRRPVKRRNAKRAAVAYALAYGSKARVEWMKTQPCVWCVALLPILAICHLRGPRQNAHTGKKPGKGLKSHFTTIVPLCALHHRKYDRYLKPFDDPKMRAALESFAPIIAARWDALGSARGDEAPTNGR